MEGDGNGRSLPAGRFRPGKMNKYSFNNIDIMANKREFKKFVDALGASVASQIASAYENVKGANREELQEAFSQLLGAVGAAKSNANRFFDRGRKGFGDAKEYARAKETYFKSLFNKIETDFNNEVSAAIKKFNAALPAAEKAANKEAANA